MTTAPAINVSVAGDGPPMIFVHGWLNDASVWSGVVERMQDQFRCLSVDLRGHGASEAAGEGNYGRDLVLQDLRKVMDDEAIDSAIFVGHSLGGYLSLALAIEDPERVSGLGLIAAGPGFRNPKSLDQWNDSVREMAASRELPPGMEAISMHVDAMVMDRLAEITAPAVVVVGERDRRFLASAEVFEKHLDVQHRATVEDGGHMVHAKHPEEVAEALLGTFGSPAASA